MSETVNELRAGMEGRWIVQTEGSEHVFDFDAQTYRRFATAKEMPYDQTPLVFNPEYVIIWPKVGQSFALYLPIEEASGHMIRGKFRTSGPIVEIRRVE